MPIIVKTTASIKRPPQNGSVTNHQDQLITPVNFRMTKTTPINPNTPTPPDELELDSDIVTP